MNSRFAVWSMGLACVVLMVIISHVYHRILDAYEKSAALSDIEYSWFFRLLLNLVGYSTVLLPMFVMYKYLDRIKYFDKLSNTSYTYRILFFCFGEPGERLAESKPRKEESTLKEGTELVFCFTGLMTAYLVWGLLQEKIMTQNYVMSDGSTLRFNDSQFLVLVNRLAALVIAASRLACTRAALAPVPLYKFSYCALTNVLSAWCQYEALKYVSFPTQVLSKSCKVIPVMLMGKLVSRNKYELYEYVCATLISVGMVMFMFGSHDDNTASTVTTLSGAALLALYMGSDAFTSSWQGALFVRYGACPLQALCGVTLCSVALTAAAHAHRAPPLQLLHHPVFLTDCVVLSVSSAVGQLLIYRTIANFGAVMFTIIMTLRQAVSILLSCVVYGHAVSVGGGAGVALVFGAVLLRLHCRHTRLSARTSAKL